MPEARTTELVGKIALVTGGGRGVGRGIARACARAGANVAVLGRDLQRLNEVVDELGRLDVEALAVECDVTDPSVVDAAVAQVLDHWGRIDTLVNGAYEGGDGPLEAIDESDVERAWTTGPLGSLRMMRACLEALRVTRGSVINLGTGAGISAQRGMGVYAMVKEALRTMSRVAAVEWGPSGVRVNVLCPLADSPGFDAWQRANPERFASEVLAPIPLRRIGDSEIDVGRAAVFLASESARYITGTTLMVDGGLTYLR